MPVGKKRLQVHLDKRMNPQTVLQHSLGILLIFYTGKAPGRLFVAFMITIKPFDNEVANHTAHDSNEKRDYNFHSDTSSLLRVLVSNTKIITYYPKNTLYLFSFCVICVKLAFLSVLLLLHILYCFLHCPLQNNVFGREA